jgi:hypothetical protein
MSCVRPEYIAADEPAGGKSCAGNDAMMSEITILFTFVGECTTYTVWPISPLYQLNSHTLIHQWRAWLELLDFLNFEGVAFFGCPQKSWRQKFWNHTKSKLKILCLATRTPPIDRASIHGICFSILDAEKPRYCRSGLWDFETRFAYSITFSYSPMMPDMRAAEIKMTMSNLHSHIHFGVFTQASTVQACVR